MKWHFANSDFLPAFTEGETSVPATHLLFTFTRVCLGGSSGSLKWLLQFETGAVVSFFGLPNPPPKAGEQGHKKIALEEGDQKHKVYF